MQTLEIQQALNTVVQLPYTKLYKNGLEIDQNIDHKQWSELTVSINLIRGSTMWWWGDLLNFGERKFGEMYGSAMDSAKMSYGTLANASFVCSRIQFSRRHENLTYTHHQEIAIAFSDEVEQDKWLDRAETEKLSVIELRKAIRLSKMEYGDDEQSKEANSKLYEAFLVFKSEFNKEIKKSPIQEWSRQRLEAFDQDFKWISDVRIQISIALNKG